MTDCLICERLALWRAGQNPYFIHEFEHTIFVVGDHQYYRGYSLLLLKQHVRELHELTADVQQGMFREVMQATNALVTTFQPDKMNHTCLGNKEEHVHWHIIPRHKDGHHYGRHPFRDLQDWDQHRISAEEAQAIAAKIRANLG